MRTKLLKFDLLTSAHTFVLSFFVPQCNYHEDYTNHNKASVQNWSISTSKERGFRGLIHHKHTCSADFKSAVASCK